MKNKRFLAIILFSFLQLVSASIVAKPIKKSTKAVNVEIELEEIPNVQTYEIEVKKTSDKKESLQNFYQKDSFFKIKLNVGNYLLRTRMITKLSETGPWSEWTELLARPEEVNLIDLPSYDISMTKKQQAIDIVLKWQNANGADSYQIWIDDLVNKKVYKKSSRAAEASVNLKAGAYKIGVQSVSKDGIRSDIKYFENSFLVTHAQLPQIVLKRIDQNSFQWIKQDQSNVKIDIYRKAFFSDKYVKIESLKIVEDKWLLPPKLEPGEYKIDFQYTSDEFENGPIQSVSFLKKPTEKNFPVLAR
ncbi:MAG: hypothetical protein AABY53_08855 [Bdellovibrionota bacterium]